MRTRILLVIIAVLLCIGCSLEKPTLFSVTVKRVMGEYESRDELREYATLEAKRQALEQAGAYLETQTVVQNSRLVKDDVTALAAAVLSTKQANEKWEMEGGHFVIWLTYEIRIESNDLERRIKDLIQERQKIEDYKQLQAENARLEKEIADLHAQLEKSGASDRDELKQERKKLSKELTAAEWFFKALEETKPDIRIEFYTNAIKFAPEWESPFNNRGSAYDDKGDYDRAIADYNKALSIKPKLTETYNNRGVAYFKKGDYARAIADYDKALLIDPDYANAYINRGNVLVKKGELDRAIADYNKALSMNPNSTETYINRGSAYYFKGDYDRVITNCNKALSINPNSIEAYYSRGNAYRHKCDYDQAISDYNKALSMNPDYADAYINRGIAYYGKGDKYRAKLDFLKAKSLGHPKAQQNLDLLNGK